MIRALILSALLLVSASSVYEFKVTGLDGGKIDLNDAGCKPAKQLRTGDRLKIGRGEERLEVEVLALSDKRGPASVAQTLFRETETSRVAREAAREQRQLVGAAGPAKRPDKQDRRELRRMKHTR